MSKKLSKVKFFYENGEEVTTSSGMIGLVVDRMVWNDKKYYRIIDIEHSNIVTKTEVVPEEKLKRINE